MATKTIAKISQFAGAWKDVGEKEAKEMFDAIKKARAQTDASLRKKIT